MYSLKSLSFNCHNNVVGYWHPFIRGFPFLLTLMFFLSSLMLHLLYAITGREIRFCVRLLNLHPVCACLSSVDIFISTWIFTSIGVPSGCNACMAENG